MDTYTTSEVADLIGVHPKMVFCGIQQWELEEMLFVVFHNMT